MIGTSADEQKVRVLIVDDDPAAARLLGVLINFEPDLQYVGTLERQEHLLEAIEGTSCDVVLLDLFMPGQNSIETVRSLREAGCQAGVIVYTGWPGDTLLSEAVRAGADACISKSTEPNELFTTIRDVAARESFHEPQSSAASDLRRRSAL